MRFILLNRGRQGQADWSAIYLGRYENFDYKIIVKKFSNKICRNKNNRISFELVWLAILPRAFVIDEANVYDIFIIIILVI